MQTNLPRRGPLSGVTVVDLTRALAGPYATLLLSGLGARVIRIEQPGLGDGRTNAPFLGPDGPTLRQTSDADVSIAHLIRHRGKESITLNLKHGEAAGLFAELVKHADVVVENYTRGTAERLGVGYSQAKAANPAIVYCSISGFGQEGDVGGGKAMDGIIQALSGLMLTSGSEGDPPVRVGVPFADLNTPLFAVIGIVSALYHRAATGQGQYVDVSMLGVLTAMQAIEPFKILEDLGVPTRTGNSMPRLTPFGAFRTSDGHVMITCSGDANFRRLAAALGQPGLPEDERFKSQSARLANYTTLDGIVEAWTSQRTATEAVTVFEAHGVPAAIVRTPDEAVNDPRVQARGEIVTLKHPDLDQTLLGPGMPIVFSETRAQFDEVTAKLGADNAAIWGELLGRSPEDLARLKAEGAI
jgi:crotonobetainyl-CoA:carnitine CoA-transferase CaiB-like acyl-CoA transferase